MKTTAHPLSALMLGAGLSLCLLTGPVHAGEEVDWSRQLARATWPGDIVRWADQVPGSDPAASQVQDVRRRAAEVLSLLRSQDVQLFRSAFQSELGTAERNADLRLAALGDANAAFRIARLYQSGQVPRDDHRYIGWLQLAAKLGHERAAYDLALHFRREGQLVQASAYEARAVALGYTPPLALDHVRK
jgi:TPR repeat protein